MCKLVINKVGPIKHVDMDVKKVTMIIGPQSSGKSTIAKILCHCQWIEKRCFTNPAEIDFHRNHFRDGIEEYYRMEGYISPESYIKYVGDYITLEYKDKNKIAEIAVEISGTEKYQYPKLGYIPASRNFVSMIPNLKKYNESNDLLMYFIYDWTTSRDYIKHVDLGNILQRNISFSFDKKDGKELVTDSEVTIMLQNASSGVQSLLPLYVVSSYLMEGIYKRIKPLSTEQKDQIKQFMSDFQVIKQITDNLKSDNPKDLDSESQNILKEALSALTGNSLFKTIADDVEGLQDSLQRKFFYKLSSLYIEEGEQNLFPEAQAKFIYWILNILATETRNHTTFFTTHSPYMLFSLNNCLMGYLVKDKLPNEIVKDLPSVNSWINPKSVALYQIVNGELVSIQDEDGLLKENYINDAYRKNSAEYMTMLSYYDAQ